MGRRRETIRGRAPREKERAPHFPDKVEEPNTRYDRRSEREAVEAEIKEALDELAEEETDT